MTFSVSQWHQRYVEQSGWTASLRQFVFDQVKLAQAGSVLEVGCGTGAILETLSPTLDHYGVDIDLDSLQFCHQQRPPYNLVCADGTHLPHPDATFGITFCHYLLLWVKSPLEILQEMRRVTLPGGYVVALAEPDHSARIDYPTELAVLGRMQSESLAAQGANLEIGRQLPGLFAAASFSDIQYGVSGFQRKVGDLPEWFDSEWLTLENDLAGNSAVKDLARINSMDAAAWQDGSRLLWVPTFYAYGKV
jgi:ubiquinone/menaquinone biosynthesis C-methylase UbiE